MKKIALLVTFLFIIVGCGSDDDAIRRDNPFLIDPQVNLTINLNLPQFNDLNFPGGSAVVTSQGIRGIVIYRLNEDLFTAFELSDPNHVPNDCSRMEISGIEASCPCTNDENIYNIVTGQHTTMPEDFPMQAYSITQDGNILRIRN